MKFDIDQLTLGELEDVEEVTGVNPGTLGDKPLPVKLMTAIAWVLKRRENPSFTLEQARGLKIMDLMAEPPAPNAGGRGGRGATPASSRGTATSGGSRRRTSGR